VAKEACVSYKTILRTQHQFSMAVNKTAGQESLTLILQMPVRSTVEKKMAGVHFSTMPANVTQPMRHKESQSFTAFFPVLRTLCSLGVKIL